MHVLRPLFRNRFAAEILHCSSSHDARRCPRMKRTLFKLALILLGAVPLVPGYLLMRWPEQIIRGDQALAGILIGLIVLAYFFFISKWAVKKIPGWSSILLLSACGLLMLILLVIQEVAIGSYWSGLLGLLPQAYFVPVNGLCLKVMAGGAAYSWMAPMTGYFLQVLLSVIGGNVKMLRY